MIKIVMIIMFSLIKDQQHHFIQKHHTHNKYWRLIFKIIWLYAHFGFADTLTLITALYMGMSLVQTNKKLYSTVSFIPTLILFVSYTSQSSFSPKGTHKYS